MNDFIQMLHKKPMTLIMSLPKNDVVLCNRAFDAGADVVKVHCNLSHHASNTGFEGFGTYVDIFTQMLSEAKGPMGLVLGAEPGDVRRDMPEAAKLTFDFFSLYAHHVPPTLLGFPQALMAACGHGYALEEAACLEQCGAQALEASVIPHEGYGQPLNLRDVMGYRMLCQATRLPVVVPTQREITPEDVPYLRDAGVKAIMIGAIVTGRETESIAHAVDRFRRAIDKL